MSSKKSTIYDLAALAETSASPVSAILSGSWQRRRISEETALRVQKLAEKLKYNVNRQASGLRKSRSGLIGMIIPTHEDAFFGSMSQAFERMARARDLHPLVVGTLRDPALEVETVKTLASYRIEQLVVTGATDPDGVSRVCRHHGIRQVNVDLPGKKAPSVTTDNEWGAAKLTAALVDRSRKLRSASRDRLFFLGGVAGDYATDQRVKGFTGAVQAAFGQFDASQVRNCGYDVAAAEQAMADLHAELRGLPRGVLMASSVTLEGAIRFLARLPAEALQQCAFGSYDWNPFAACLRFPVHMMRQDIDGLLTEAFRLIDDESASPRARLVQVRPTLVLGT